MEPTRSFSLSRRAALAALGAGGLSLAQAARTAAQDATPAAGGDAAVLDAAFKVALGARDVDGAVALFAPMGVEVSPFGIFQGTDAIRGFTAQFLGTPGLAVTFGETTVVLDTAVHRAFIASDPVRAAGIERFAVFHTLVAAQGKLVTVTAVLDLSDEQTARFAAAQQGAAEASPTA